MSIIARGSFSAAMNPLENARAWADVADVYDADAIGISRELAEDSAATPLFAAFASSLDLEQAAARRGRFIRASAKNDWSEYEAVLRAQGASAFAQQDIPFSVWHDALCSFVRVMTPRLVRAFGADPTRLNEALGALHAIHARAINTLANEYWNTKETLLRRAEARFDTLRRAGILGMVVSRVDGTILDASTTSSSGFSVTHAMI